MRAREYEGSGGGPHVIRRPSRWVAFVLPRDGEDALDFRLDPW